MSSSATTYGQSLRQPGLGGGEAPHPFAVAVEAEQPVRDNELFLGFRFI